VLDWLKADGSRSELTFSVISEWYDNPQYIELLRNRIKMAMDKTSHREKTGLLFSAHSLPVKMIEAGDPYLEHVKRTAALAGEGYDFILSFQSRSGPVRWQGPETTAVIKELGQSGLKSLVVVPVSFVSDHIETLHEIDIELKELANASGIEEFIRMESFNDDPRFIQLLTDLIEEKISGGRK
ncbi:MAG: ferrochelatase, partial [Candidatus Zixiibacteriota bacterium]